MRWILLAALVVVSCKSKSPSDKAGGASSATTAETSSGGTSKLTLTEAGNETNKVTVEMAVPPSWKTDSSAPPPAWKMDGAQTLTLVLVDAGGKDNAARVEKAIKMNFGDLTGATRNDYPDGRVWIAAPQGDRTHARMFVPNDHGVVMGFAMLADKSKLDGVKATFETIKVVP